MQPNIEPAALGHWRARLELDVARVGERTAIVRRSHFGPLYVQRAFYPEGNDLPHIYLLHPPGGLVGGDRLEVQIDVGEQATALVTTPAAQKLYRSSGAHALQQVTLTVGRGACLEWLPTDTIVFDGALARLSTEVAILPGAGFLGWDIGCLGRTACGESFRHGELDSTLQIVRRAPNVADQPLLFERVRVNGGSPQLSQAWGYGGAPVFANLYCVPRDPAHLPELEARVRACLGESEGCAVTAMDGLLIVRCLAADSQQARRVLLRAWQVLRPCWLGRVACPPRIWAT